MHKLTSLLSLVICACSSNNIARPIVVPDSQSSLQTPKTRPNHDVSDRPLVTKPWSIKMSPGWNTQVISEPAGSDPRSEFKSISTAVFGRGPMILTVKSTTLDDDPNDVLPPEKFGDIMLESAKTVPSVHVIASSNVVINKHPGTLMMFVAGPSILIVQLSVGYNVRGYTVTCGGDLAKGEEIVTLCQPMITSFQLR